MTKIQDLKLILTIALFFLLIITTQYFRPKYERPIISGQETNYTINSDVISILSLGQQKLFSSYLWMNTLLFSDHDHVKDNKNSWMFHRFKLISKLNPHFYENYKFGGLYLSIVKDDLYGAEQIYGEGLRYFIDDEFLLWNRGFNLCMEMNDCEAALPYFSRLSDINSTRYPLSSRIASKIKNGLGLYEEAFAILEDNYNRLPEGPLKISTFRTLYNLKSSKDLKCLNKEVSKNKCNLKDLEGVPYKKQNGLFVSNHPDWKDSILLKKRGGHKAPP